MASIVLGLVGAGIGAFIGGPQGAMLGWSAGVTLAGIVFPPKLQAQERGRIDDMRMSGSGYGSMIPEVYGRARVGSNIIWSTNLDENQRSEDVGGKGGGQEVTTYSYHVSFAVAVCKGPIDHIEKIWAEDILIWNVNETPHTKYNVTIYKGDEAQTADPLMVSVEGAGNVPAYRGTCYVVFESLPLRKWGNRIPAITFEVVQSTAATVGSVISGVFGDVGLTGAEFNVDLANAVSIDGYVISSRQSARDAIEPLLTLYSVDLTEYDGRIQAIPRGGTTDITVSAGDYGADFFQGELPATSDLAIKRMSDFELPFSIEVSYFDKGKKYQQGTQLARRYTKDHLDDKVTITTPCVLTADKARQLAETKLYQQWAEREQFQIMLPPSYIKAVPTSVLSLPSVAGSTVRVRVIAMDIALFGPLQLTCVLDDSTVLSQIIAGGSLGTETDTLSNPGTVAFVAFCCNAIRDEDADNIGFYIMAAGQEGWSGVQVYKRRTGNAFRPFKRITQSGTYGVSLSALPTWNSTGSMDNTNHVDIDLQTGDLETTSFDDMLAGGNAALLGDEIIQFTTVTYMGGTTYRLSGLLRGQRGTDYAWGSHVIGDRFILLREDLVYRVNVERGLIGKEIDLKAITEDEQLADVTQVPVIITGQELKPYSPCQIVGSRDGGLNLTIDWVRRVRKNGEMADLGDVELDEPVEAYDVEIWTPGFGSVVRTFSGIGTSTQVYTAAQQTTDFGSAQPSVCVRIYQLGDFKNTTTVSRTRGYPGSATL